MNGNIRWALIALGGAYVATIVAFINSLSAVQLGGFILASAGVFLIGAGLGSSIWTAIIENIRSEMSEGEKKEEAKS